MQKILGKFYTMEVWSNNNVILQTEFFGNKVYEYVFGFLVFFGSIIVLKIFKAVVIGRLKIVAEKTKTQLDDMLISAIQKIHWPFYVFVSIYIALQFVNVHQAIKTASYYVFLVAVVFYTIRFLENLIDYVVKKVLEKQVEDANNFAIVRLVGSVAKVGLWVGAIVLILSNMGYNVTSLIAGLGIGGIAVALALQNILGDLFSSLAIYFDKPFKVGDFVAVGTEMGTVKKVGIKTTRIQVPQGEELVVANTDLSKSQVRNFGVMKRRRGVINLGVAYETPPKTLRAIPEMIKKIIEKHKEAEVDRVHFTLFGDSALMYDIVFYVNSPEYPEFLDIQQEINLEILEKFAKEKIEIAYPTRTVYVRK